MKHPNNVQNRRHTPTNAINRCKITVMIDETHRDYLDSLAEADDNSRSRALRAVLSAAIKQDNAKTNHGAYADATN